MILVFTIFHPDIFDIFSDFLIDRSFGLIEEIKIIGLRHTFSKIQMHVVVGGEMIAPAKNVQRAAANESDL